MIEANVIKKSRDDQLTSTNKPAPMLVSPENIPDELKWGRQFVVWCWEMIEGRWTKPPYHPSGRRARSNDPGTWVSFDEALDAHRRGDFDGVGRCFVEGDVLTAFDLDKCRGEDGKPELWAASIMTRLNTYTEITPSGTGYRPWVIAQKPGPRSGRKDPDIEIYDRTSKRYLCLTGHALDGHRRIEPRQAETNEIYKEMFEAPAHQRPQEGGEPFVWDGAVDSLPVSRRIKDDILTGFPKGERSEPMMGVLNALVWSCLTDNQIYDVFEKYPVGSKYRERGDGRQKWLQPQIEKARAMTQERATARNTRKEGIARRRPSETQESHPTSHLTLVDDWPEPMPLPDGMPPVAQFDFNLFPGTLRDWTKDIVERIQCPPDFVVVVIMAALAAVIGRKIGVRPQEFTDWTVICNMWAFLIGRPGVLKSPAMEAALAPLKRLAALSVERFQVEITEFENTKIVEKLRVEAAEKAARAALKKDPGADLSRILRIEKTEAPILARYIANDTTAAALGELHRQNPNGLLVFRDELVSLLKMLDREDNAEARGFYLTGWNGDSAYTFDRITRGFHLNIPAVCLSLVGSTQPGRIAQYVKAAVNGGVGDDGFLQRFGLLVWPDVSGVWRDVDRWPDSRASQQAHRVFERLDRFDPLSVGAIQDTGANGRPEGIPYLRFDPAGLGLFREWRQELEARLRFDEVHSALESHLSKYRKLVPGLALIIHLANGEVGSVGRPAVLRALAWAEYLETHAKRLYASVTAPDAATARAILKKISSGALPSAFTIREVWRPQWTGLTDLDHIKSGINMLTERDWLIEVRKDTGGRPTFEYRITPRAEGSI